VIVGVAAGAGVLIAVGQVPHFLGISVDRTRHLPGALGMIERMWPHLREINWLAVMIAMVSLAVLLVVRSISKFLPAALLAIVTGAIIVAASGKVDALPVIGELPRQLPQFHLPKAAWTHGHALVTGALALAILGVLEAVAIAKTIAAQSGERIDPNQECFAQGLKNLSSSFVQCIPGSASFTRSMLDYAAGAQTRFAAVFNAIFVAIIFLLFAAQARFIPLASLAAVLMVIAWRLFDWRYMLRVARTSRADALVCVVTFLATVIAPLEYAIFIGIFMNIGVYLRSASRLHVAEMVQSPAAEGTFLERPLRPRQAASGNVVFLQLEGELFFAVADELQDHLGALQHGGAKVVILRLKRTHSIDPTVLGVIENFARAMHKQNAHVILCGIRPELMEKLRAFGLIELLGPDNVIQTGEGVWTSARQAIERARQIVGETEAAATDSAT
jgi:SulP family sulfate permease